eukprot:COSAG02_NODE_4317_length_5511_cov_264.675536_7_plen_71_part_00
MIDGISLLPVIEAVMDPTLSTPTRSKPIGHATMLPGDAWDAKNGRASLPSFDSSYVLRGGVVRSPALVMP